MITAGHLPHCLKICNFARARYAKRMASNGVARCSQPTNTRMPAINQKETRSGSLNISHRHARPYNGFEYSFRVQESEYFYCKPVNYRAHVQNGFVQTQNRIWKD